ncbi:MAG: ATP-binding cassette domain-containing protein [Thiotrichaceae bacterium]
MAQDVLLQASNLHRHYGRHHAVAGVSIRIHQGEVLGLLGPNGAGKSTMMQMLTGNIAPGSGQITIAGIDLLDDPREAKQHIGYLPEQPPVYRDMTVLEYLRYCAKLHGLVSHQLTSAVDFAMQRCGLTEVGKRLIGNLSKGYQQRTGIAQAILHQPSVVILDEPTVGLDPVQINEIRKLIRELGNDHSVILSTHILPEVKMICDRVQIMTQGKTAFEDTLEGLERRHGDPVLLLGFNHEIDTTKLEALQEIIKVENVGLGRYKVHFQGHQHFADTICKLAFAERWEITELTPQSSSLESIFLDLVHREGEAA